MFRIAEFKWFSVTYSTIRMRNRVIFRSIFPSDYAHFVVLTSELWRELTNDIKERIIFRRYLKSRMCTGPLSRGRGDKNR